MLNAINSVMLIFLMIAVGFYFRKKGMFTEETNKLFSQVVIKISLPASVLVSIPARFTRDTLIHSLEGIVISFSIILTIYLISLVAMKLFNVKRKDLSVTMFMFSNTIFIGLPVNMALFGTDSMPYVFLFYFANTFLFWSLGIGIIKGSGGEKMSIGERLKKLTSPPLLAFLVSIAITFMDVKLPVPLEGALKYLGGMTTPLAMLFLGTVIANFDRRSISLDRDGMVVLVGRFLVAPLVAIIILFIFEGIFSIDPLLKKVYIIQASMPIMANIAIISKYYNRDYEYASMGVGISTILCLFTIPLYAILLDLII